MSLDICGNSWMARSHINVHELVPTSPRMDTLSGLKVIIKEGPIQKTRPPSMVGENLLNSIRAFPPNPL